MGCLAAIAVNVICDDKAALMGAAQRAFELADSMGQGYT